MNQTQIRRVRERIEQHYQGLLSKVSEVIESQYPVSIKLRMPDKIETRGWNTGLEDLPSNVHRKVKSFNTQIDKMVEYIKAHNLEVDSIDSEQSTEIYDIQNRIRADRDRMIDQLILGDATDALKWVENLPTLDSYL